MCVGFSVLYNLLKCGIYRNIFSAIHAFILRALSLLVHMPRSRTHALTDGHGRSSKQAQGIEVSAIICSCDIVAFILRALSLLVHMPRSRTHALTDGHGRSSKQAQGISLP